MINILIHPSLFYNGKWNYISHLFRGVGFILYNNIPDILRHDKNDIAIVMTPCKWLGNEVKRLGYNSGVLYFPDKINYSIWNSRNIMIDFDGVLTRNEGGRNFSNLGMDVYTYNILEYIMKHTPAKKGPATDLIRHLSGFNNLYLCTHRGGDDPCLRKNINLRMFHLTKINATFEKFGLHMDTKYFLSGKDKIPVVLKENTSLVIDDNYKIVQSMLNKGIPCLMPIP